VRARIAVLAALAALAGCTDELDEFRGDLRPLEQRAEEQRSVVSGLLRSLRLSSRTDARGVRAQAADLSATYDEIATLDPPDDYAEPFAEYVEANRAVVRDLRRLAAELESGDLRGVRRASDRALGALSRAHTSSLRWLE
jgi:hypothetical protein